MAAPELVLGPILRYVDDRRATMWVEADRRCTVDVLGCSGPTFEVEGHHYGLVLVEGLEPATEYPYEVRLDGEVRWPAAESDLPASVIRTADPERPLRLLFGSCRVAVPDEPPYNRPRIEEPEGHGVDALLPYAIRMATRPSSEWPDHLLMLGDQTYADDGAPETRARIRANDGTSPRARPSASEVDEFEEYTWLYQEAWRSPMVRWLMSTVPSAMIFDDHDVINDWNTSMAWLRNAEEQPWWDDHLTGGLMAYWVYQHLGNLSPEGLAGDELYAEVRATDGDAGPAVRRFARNARVQSDRSHPPGRWSFTRDLTGGASARLVMIDVRNSRQLAEGDRAMLDHDDWQWIDDHTTGGVDHVLLGTSLPFLLPPGVHDFERCSDVLTGGSWGPPGRWLGEKARRTATLEHWAAFGHSFEDLAALIVSVGSGERGEAPSSVLVLSGDVHFSYVAPFEPDASDVTSRVVQLVSSPFRNSIPQNLERALRFAQSRLGALAGRIARRIVPTEDCGGTWDITGGPWFGNALATVELHGPTAKVRFERSRLDHTGEPDLVTVHEETLVRPRR